jgi:predicted transcriptional regulator YheO
LAGSSSVLPAEIDFTDDIRRVLENEVRQVEREVGGPLDRSSKKDRIALVAGLKKRGAFAVQRAVPFVADYLGVSRATVYAYLDELRQSRDEDAEPD